MDTKLLSFIFRYLGMGGVGTNPVNRGQCVGLVEVWLFARDLPFIGGNAKDLLANADRSRFNVIPNGPNNHPGTGDVVCWDASWGGGYGHTAVVLVANTMHLVVFEQNDPTGAPCLVATHGYGGVLGWCSPR